MLFWTRSTRESTMFSCITTSSTTVSATAAAAACNTAAMSDSTACAQLRGLNSRAPLVSARLHAHFSARLLSVNNVQYIAHLLTLLPVFLPTSLFSDRFFPSNEQLPGFLPFWIRAIFVTAHRPTDRNVEYTRVNEGVDGIERRHIDRSYMVDWLCSNWKTGDGTGDRQFH